ncbi:MAG TPA: collagenase-like protease [Flavobacteriales bacterium]|nr:collagenase-like protease [Flavobacteriales bacterium]
MELMAPAGSFEALQAAIQSGADSVYFGVEQLNMRAKSSINFTLNDLPEIARRCNEANVRTYLTMNTIVYDHDLSIIKTLTNKAKEAGITAIIASDQAVINYGKTAGVEIHISTQVNVTNLETVKFYANFSDVMVLSRELTLRQVKKIVDGIKKENITGPSGRLVQVEIFGHGALCMAVSGKCYLSLHTHNSSANRGACIQNCRRTYTVIDKEEGYELDIDNEYIMSPKDLCTIDFLDQVMATGISVLKIEGRGRAPEYVYTTVQVYREAIDSVLDGTYSEKKVADWMARLDKVYNRGFWSGYYLGQKIGEWSKKHGSQATEKKVYLAKGMHYFPQPKVGQFRMEALKLSVGDQILITGPTTGVVYTEVKELMVNDKKVSQASKGDDFTMPIDQIIRPSDKLYKIVAS